MSKRCKGFGYMRKKVPKLSDANLQDGIYIRPQSPKIVNYVLLECLLKYLEICTPNVQSDLSKFSEIFKGRKLQENC